MRSVVICDFVGACCCCYEVEFPIDARHHESGTGHSSRVYYGSETGGADATFGNLSGLTDQGGKATCSLTN